MNVRDLIPWGRQSDRIPVNVANSGLETNPIASLHREMNRLFEDAWRAFDAPAWRFGGMGAWPNVELSESDTEVRVMAELPGLTEKDIELMLDDGVLCIRGERRSEERDERRSYSECYYGRFERRIPLPGPLREEAVEARFRNGVLTVTVPKAEDALRARRIPINVESRH